jgi:hypothetical protein
MSIKPAHAHSTSRDTAIGRVRVEHGETAQATGTQFQVAQSSTAAALPQVLRVDAPEPIDVTEMQMTVNLGGVNISIFEAADGTEGGTFTPVSVSNTNRRNPQAPSFSASAGGTFTPTGDPVLPPMLASVDLGGRSVNERQLSLPAGTYFFVTGLLSGVTSFTGQLVLTISEVLEP